MPDEDPQPNAEPAEGNAPAPALPLKGLKKISPIYMKILAGSSWILPLLAFVVALAVIMAIVSRQLAEPTLDTTAKAGELHCNTWAETPVGFQAIIENASAKFGIRPALLAAIYKQENENSWKPKRWAGEEDWPVSPPPDYAAGPFQFIPATWSGEINKSIVKNKCGILTKDDVNDKVKASCVAAYYLSDKLKNSGISNELDTEDEQDIKDVAVAYSSSFDYFDNWRKSGRDPSKLNPRYLAYHTNVWKTFNDLNKGCVSNTGTSGKLDDHFQNLLQTSWLTSINEKGAPMIKGTMKPTGVVLHWTAGSNKEGAISAMGTRKAYVHLIIDKQGKAYQLLPLNSWVRSGSGDGNSFAIGIEIVGLGESDFIDTNGNIVNKSQHAAVIETVNYLIKQYNIPNIKGSPQNLPPVNKYTPAGKGIFGHLQVQSNSGGSWDGLVRGCRSAKIDPGKNYLRKIWKDLGTQPENDCLDR